MTFLVWNKNLHPAEQIPRINSLVDNIFKTYCSSAYIQCLSSEVSNEWTGLYDSVQESALSQLVIHETSISGFQFENKSITNYKTLWFYTGLCWYFALLKEHWLYCADLCINVIATKRNLCYSKIIWARIIRLWEKREEIKKSAVSSSIFTKESQNLKA